MAPHQGSNLHLFTLGHLPGDQEVLILYLHRSLSYINRYVCQHSTNIHLCVSCKLNSEKYIKQILCSNNDMYAEMFRGELY